MSTFNSSTVIRFVSITVVEKFRLHPGPHTLTACIIMVASSGTIHALMDVVLTDSLAVGLTGVLRSTVTVNYNDFQCRISSHGIFQCLHAQVRFHVCFKIKAVKNPRYIQFSIGRWDLCDVCNTFFNGASE